jgi:hypothetical protein
MCHAEYETIAFDNQYRYFFIYDASALLKFEQIEIRMLFF